MPAAPFLKRPLGAALTLATAVTLMIALTPAGTQAYSWPVKPFHKSHAIRATFGDPRFHLGPESQLSAFHFGVDIVARDGAPVFAVEPGVVVRRHHDSVTIGRRSGRRFGYWHVRPVVKSGTHVRLHQLVGHVIAGWGHVHFAESLRGSYRNPLRTGALTPFRDRTVPTIAWVQVRVAGGTQAANLQHIVGSIDIVANVYDTPPIAPPPPWNLARLAPASVSWDLLDSKGAVIESSVAAYFDFGLPPNSLYSWIYASGTYQNKPNRPGQYIFWLAHGLDTTALPDGAYTLEVMASDSRRNIGTVALALTTANGVAPR